MNGDFVEVSIGDTGIGIPENQIGTIFQPFNQVVSSSTRKFGGTGIGLTITKKLIELHGGTIRVKSVEGEGSVFTFSLPVSEKTAQIVDFRKGVDGELPVPRPGSI